MDDVNLIFWCKGGVGPDGQYLSANFEKVQLKDGLVVW